MESKDMVPAKDVHVMVVGTLDDFRKKREVSFAQAMGRPRKYHVSVLRKKSRHFVTTLQAMCGVPEGQTMRDLVGQS